MDDWIKVKARLECHHNYWTSERAKARLLDEPELAADVRAALARVEELERERLTVPHLGLKIRCEAAEAKLREKDERIEDLIEGGVALQAKLARCVEALEEGLLLTASWADVRTHNWRNEVRAALAAAKGE